MNIVLYVLLGAVVIAAVTVGILLLRKRGVIGNAENGREAASGIVQPPPGTKPLDSYEPAPAWQEGDPENIETEPIGGGRIEGVEI